MKPIDDIRRDNLAVLRDQYGGLARFAEHLGKSDSQVSQWVQGATHSATGKQRGMSTATARYIEDRCRLPTGWLDVEHARQVDLGNHPDLAQVPRVRFKLSAGVSGYAIEPEAGNGKPVFFRRDWFDTHGYRPEKLFAVRVTGESMEPALYDGDLVVVNTDDTAPRDGDAFAINYEGELVIKRLRRDAGEWWAASDNADQRRYAPKLCTEDVKIVGRIIYKQSERI
jgi:phage repressor protein C with HTH and peptisase S24 domain